ncbi:MAG: tetratricopeptide repeat protein, partial [Alphaproteobacteria bacterium]|nr:tetratricopeptide repeat protein [Alphaproteobacteria bacterium]
MLIFDRRSHRWKPIVRVTWLLVFGLGLGTTGAGAAPGPAPVSSSALSELEKRAEAGEAAAQVTLGLSFVNGANGVAVNESKALQWLKLAAEQGDVRGLYNLCSLYAKSRLLADPFLAFRACKKAADKGYPPAEYALAKFYERGQGVEADPKLRLKFLTAAAEHGLTTAQYDLGLHYTRVTVNGKFDQDKIKKWFTLAADSGHVLSLQKLGEFYLRLADEAVLSDNNRLPNPEGEAAKPPP